MRHTMRHTMRHILATTLALLLWLPSASAYWNPDPGVHVPVSTAPGEKYDAFTVTDGVGGAIIAWEDERGGDSDIYVQRVNARGEALWQADGVPVCTAPNDQYIFHSSTGTTGFTPIVPDGQGGAYIAWQDARFFGARQNDIYCQRVSADGEPLFTPNGLPIATSTGMEDQPTLCADGEGGIFVIWQDKNTDPVFYDLWGQHVSAAGERLWNGGTPRPLVEAGWDQDAPTACPDGSGGFFLAWTDSRANLNDIFAGRFDSGGYPLWTPGGVPVFQNGNGQDAIVIQSAADGHPLLAWVDRRTGSPDIYAQKLDAADGSPLWSAAGVAVCGAPNSQYRPALAPDAGGGAYVAWFDYRNAPSGPPWNLDIFASRLLDDGTLAPGWPTNGLAVCGAPDAQRDVDVCADWDGGLFLAWEDNRAGTGHEDVYAQQVDASGNLLLEADGRLIASAPNNQNRPDLVAGAGGVILAWPDDRDHIYEQDVYADRLLPHEDPVCSVSRLQVDFGDVTGIVSLDFVIGNVGESPFSIEDLTLTEGDQGFSVIPAATPPVDLPPSDVLIVQVQFDPAEAPFWDPPLADTLEIWHDAPRLAWRPDTVSPILIPLSASAAAMDIGRPQRHHPSWRLRCYPSSGFSSLRIEFLPEASSVQAGTPHTGMEMASTGMGISPTGMEISPTGMGMTQGWFEILDPSGRIVRRIPSGPVGAEGVRIIWHGEDSRGRPAPSGIYLLRWRAAQEPIGDVPVPARRFLWSR